MVAELLLMIEYIHVEIYELPFPANSLNWVGRLSGDLSSAQSGNAGVPEPGLMGRGTSRACLGLRTLWRRPSWVRIPPPAPLRIILTVTYRWCHFPTSARRLDGQRPFQSAHLPRRKSFFDLEGRQTST